MPPMVQYAHVAEPNAPAMNAAFDISSTVLATLSAAAQLTPLPFLQEASFLALAILNTVRGAKDNKESFKALANDACELVSAILCVYQDMEKDGLTPSLGLKKRVEDLIILLKAINQFSQKHIAKGAFHRMVRLQTENGKILQYRARLRQALDVFGLQSNITIHETVVQILQELRERDSQEQTKKGESESKSEPSSPPPPDHPFGNLLHGNITGNIRINNIAGNQEIHSTRHYTTIVDSYNNRTFTSRSQSSEDAHRRDP
ncbi:hypothetical protein B0H13DRAFT_519912 [Mycena leptocephala]|nr:hypothetical protein B0H13DRAFT_519912 [Mycena leptocephala]